MNKDLIYLEGGETILNVNSIAMVFPDERDLDNITCINCIGIQRTFYIHEKYEDVKNKLDNWRCCSQKDSIPCFEKDEKEEEEEE